MVYIKEEPQDHHFIGSIDPVKREPDTGGDRAEEASYVKSQINGGLRDAAIETNGDMMEDCKEKIDIIEDEAMEVSSVKCEVEVHRETWNENW